jgi:hypothetical protein
LPGSISVRFQEEGLSSLQNGALLTRASLTFDVLVTADQRLQYQQHIPKYDIGVVVISARDVRLPSLRTALPQLREAIERVGSGELIVVNVEG